MRQLGLILTTAILALLPAIGFAGGGAPAAAFTLGATNTALGITALIFFTIAYILVMTEEFTELRKSKPVVLCAGILWFMVVWVANQQGLGGEAVAQLRHNLLEYTELFFFLLVAMTYINALEERLVFDALRSWLVRKGFSYKHLFWITGIVAFFLSPIADNLTTALLMCAVVMAVGAKSPRFISIACINIVVSANAGGAFSPFGDITTLMVWQAGILPIEKFLVLFVPSVVNYVIPAALMHFAVPDEQPAASNESSVVMRRGAISIIVLFLLTILTAVLFHHSMGIPPVIGMMTGFGYLQVFAFFLKKTATRVNRENVPETDNFNVFKKVGRAEWDTLLFFYGVLMSVGAIAAFGYLELVSNTMYQTWGAGLPEIHTATPANIVVGVLSAIVDNIPVMYSVITMHPEMSTGQWLLVTLTAGVGGSLLSVGSAAGVALMGQAKGMYTFTSHLRWSWAIGLGYIASIACHIVLNNHMFYQPLGT